MTNYGQFWIDERHLARRIDVAAIETDGENIIRLWAALYTLR